MYRSILKDLFKPSTIQNKFQFRSYYYLGHTKSRVIPSSSKLDHALLFYIVIGRKIHCNLIYICNLASLRHNALLSGLCHNVINVTQPT